MRSSIVTVGTEILFGQIVNTNSAWLSRELNDLGIDVMYHFAVGDNDQRLADILGDALDNTDLVITTGGLGPTEDDLTKETVSHVMHDELAVHAEDGVENARRDRLPHDRRGLWGLYGQYRGRPDDSPSSGVMLPLPNPAATTDRKSVV